VRCSGSRRTQSKGPFDGDFAVSKVVVIEDFRMLGFGEVAVSADDFHDLPLGQFVALVAEALAHLCVEIDGVNELDLAFALARFAIGHDPDIGIDAGVVESWSGRATMPSSQSFSMIHLRMLLSRSRRRR